MGQSASIRLLLAALCPRGYRIKKRKNKSWRNTLTGIKFDLSVLVNTLFYKLHFPTFAISTTRRPSLRKKRGSNKSYLHSRRKVSSPCLRATMFSNFFK